MSDLVPVFSGEVMLAGWRETHKSGAVVSFFLADPAELEKFRGLTVKKGGTAGQRFMAVLVEISDNEEPAVPGRPEPPGMPEKPFGKQAADLYRVGFFFNPIVMAAVGTDQDYLDWLKTQPCCVRGIMIADKAHDGDIVPAHVRRIAAGAGTAIKPSHSAVPLCDGHHKLQHQHGESELGGKDWFDHQRARHLSRWMAQRVFSQESMGYVAPPIVSVWARKHNLVQYLPEAYR